MRYFILFFFCVYVLKSNAQNLNNQVFDIYKKQYDEMITGNSRAPVGNEFANVLSGYNTSNLKSNKDFADLLKNLYPTHRGIGVLFFFYNEGVLHRTFFRPGEILEEKEIMISPSKLSQMNEDLLFALKVESKAANRAPIKRGVKVTNNNAARKDVNIESLTKEINKILLPDNFDTTFKQLIIIPALNIGTFPFQILKPYSDNSYLIEKCSFTISPGVIDLIACRTLMLKENFNGSWKGNKFYIDGISDRNEDVKKADTKFKFSLSNPLFVSNPSYPKNLEYDFPDLPGAKKEVENALKYADTYKIFDGEKAIKDSIFKYWDKTDLLYMATHGVSDAQNPMLNSYLILSGTDAKLTARDIMNLAFQKKKFPEMVVLSACQSGLGKNMDVGVLGVARSFIIGGSKQVIMSLWNVDDEATAFLMNRFLYHLQTPSNFMPSEPLRLAMLDTKVKYPNPMYWASFSVFGLSY
ncbi:CHAT domain-containing protein [Pedobacter frigiditerrae]|uniref:CHAT domain-containing protein n=1 Tax=Pedobacter frigiditerrae TaxID=2530452 RepID=UPI00292E8391|nr:CHAT domain-containing protein [Pedobacter frigiditerrae]